MFSFFVYNTEISRNFWTVLKYQIARGRFVDGNIVEYDLSLIHQNIGVFSNCTNSINFRFFSFYFQNDGSDNYGGFWGFELDSEVSNGVGKEDSLGWEDKKLCEFKDVL